MGKPAARIGDQAGHGGAICFGEFKVLIENMPAARMGDPLICPASDGPKPHVMGNIISASSTVIIGGAWAARMGDKTGCGVAGVSGAGAPAVAGPAGPSGPSAPNPINYESVESGTAGDGYGYAQLTGHTGTFGSSRQLKASVKHQSATIDQGGGYTQTATADYGTSTGEVHTGAGSAGGGIQGAVYNVQDKVTDKDGNSFAGQGTVGTAQASTDILVGTDGRRTGIALGGAVQASALEAQGDAVAVIPIPFTDSSINLGSTLGGSAGSVGAAANVGAYHDAADNRVHFAGMIDIAAVFGLKLGLDISIGAKAASGGAGGGTPGVPVPAVPGTILSGASKVFIG